MSKNQMMDASLKERAKQMKAMKSILAGEEVEKTIQVGYEGKKQPKGDIESPLTDIMKEVRMPMFCPKCDVVMKKRLDNKMWRLYGHCFDCQIDFEHKLRVEGKYDEWEKTKVLENKKAFIKDQIQSVEEWITQSPLKFLNQTAIDTRVIDEEKWEDNIDRPKVGGEAIEEFQKELEKIEKELKDIYNQGE